MISYREALANAIVPALLVGPTMGAAGALVRMAPFALPDHGGGLGIALFAALIGSVLGLVSAGPLCLIFGALMLWLASRRREWMRLSRVGMAGGGVGALSGVLFASISAYDVRSVAATVALLTGLGAAGALMFRGLVRRPLNEMSRSDAQVFD